MRRFAAPLIAIVIGGIVIGLWSVMNSTVKLAPMEGRVNIVEAERDPELAAAVVRARRELPQFLAAFNTPGPNQKEFAVNARFDTDRGPERIWIRLVKYEEGFFEGTLADEPIAIKKLKMGDSVRVPESVINDWLYRDSTGIVGGYTMKLLLKRMRKSDQGS